MQNHMRKRSIAPARPLPSPDIQCYAYHILFNACHLLYFHDGPAIVLGCFLIFESYVFTLY